MGGEICHQKGRERGPWFEIESIQEVIVNKEARGEDASFERELLKSWSKYPGWESGKPQESHCRIGKKSQNTGFNPKTNEIIY